MGLSDLLLMDIAQKSLDLSDSQTSENGHLLLSRWPYRGTSPSQGGRGRESKGAK